MIPIARCKQNGSKTYAVIAIFTMALATLLIAIVVSPARADRIGPQLPGMMMEFDSIDDCVPFEPGGDPGDPGDGDGQDGDGPPSTIFGKADQRSGHKYTAPSAGTISGFSIQAPICL